jgi:predicted regulator of Ras-like GTPase activity (Roadblock/LC7/MglB family)
MAPIILQEPSSEWGGARLAALNRQSEAVLKEMERLPGAQSAFVCDLRGTALALWYTSPLSRETASRIGGCIANLFTAFQGHKFNEIEILFADRRVYARTLGNAFLTVVCAPSTSLSLIRMTCNVAAAPFETDKELQGYLARGKIDIGMRLG